MPLPEATARRHLHTRAIDFRGYERKDGLWDIEAHMTDLKSYAFHNDWRGEIEPGDPLHEMLLRLTIDDEFVIHDIEAATDNSPFAMCPDITANYKALIGVRMGPGWRQAIRERVGGIAGCTHLTELLYPMATVAMQTLWPILAQRSKQHPMHGSKSVRPTVLDSCHAWSAESPIVKRYAPDWYRGND